MKFKLFAFLLLAITTKLAKRLTSLNEMPYIVSYLSVQFHFDGNTCVYAVNRFRFKGPI